MSDNTDETREETGDDEGVDIPVNVEGDAASSSAEASDASNSREGDPESTPQPTGEQSGSDDRDAGEQPEALEEAPSSEASEVEGADQSEETGDEASNGAQATDDLFVSPDDSDVEIVVDADADEALQEAREDAERLRERVDELESAVERLKSERDEFKERMLRAAADLENYRKRAEKEKEEIEKYGSKNLVKDLLSTIDNLERALEHAQSSDEGNIIDGVDMVLSQIHDTFGKHGIEVFDAVGNTFDPEIHEAIQQVETDEHESGTVVEQFQRGYELHDRLLRPALVAVAENPSPDEAEEGEEAEANDDAEHDDQSREAGEENASTGE